VGHKTINLIPIGTYHICLAPSTCLEQLGTEVTGGSQQFIYKIPPNVPYFFHVEVESKDSEKALH